MTTESNAIRPPRKRAAAAMKGGRTPLLARAASAIQALWRSAQQWARGRCPHSIDSSPEPKAVRPLKPWNGRDPVATELFRIQLALQLLLDRHAKARHVLKNLALFEQVLELEGFAVIEVLPKVVLSRAAEQLDRLVGASPNRYLEILRSQMRAALHGASNASSVFPTLLTLESSVLIEEATHSEFQALAASEAEPLPPNRDGGWPRPR